MRHESVEAESLSSLRAGDFLTSSLLAAIPVVFGLATWDPADSSGWHIPIRLYSVPVIAIELAVLFFAMHRGFEPLKLVRSLPRRSLLALATLCAIAVGTALLVAPNPGGAIGRTLVSVVHALFGLALFWLLRGRWTALRPLVWPGTVAGILAYVGLTVAFVASIDRPMSFDWVHFGLGVNNVRHTSFYTITGITAGLALAATAQHPQAAARWAAAVTALFALAFWSGSRGAIVAVLVSLALAVAALPVMRSVRTLAITTGGLVAGAALSLIHQPPDDRLGFFSLWTRSALQPANSFTSGRIELWNGTIQTTLQKPWFGFGEGQMLAVVPEAGGIVHHPHNAILQMLLQWGGVGSLCALALIVSLALALTRRARAAPAEAAPAFMVVLGLTASSFYDGVTFFPYPIAILMLAIAFLLTAKPRASNQH